MKRTRSLTCNNKVQHATKSLAHAAMLGYRYRELGGIKISASEYKCPKCGFWHWGHTRKKKR